MEEFIHACCPYKENAKNDLCNECEINLEGKTLFAFEYPQKSISGEETIFYCCLRGFSFSRDRLGDYNKKIIFEE